MWGWLQSLQRNLEAASREIYIVSQWLVWNKDICWLGPDLLDNLAKFEVVLYMIVVWLLHFYLHWYTLSKFAGLREWWGKVLCWCSLQKWKYIIIWMSQVWIYCLFVGHKTLKQTKNRPFNRGPLLIFSCKKYKEFSFFFINIT